METEVVFSNAVMFIHFKLTERSYCVGINLGIDSDNKLAQLSLAQKLLRSCTAPA